MTTRPVSSIRIGNRHRKDLGDIDGLARNRRPFDLNEQRRKDIARLLVQRHDRLPNAGDWITYVEAAAWHCPRGNRRAALLQWLELVCAPLSMRRRHVLDAILRRFPPRRLRADTIARLLKVTDAERTALRIRTIGACDVSKAERAERSKQRRRVAEKQRRLARGIIPRERSLSRTKPWEAEGISRRTWERRRKAVSQIRAPYSSLNTKHELAARYESGPSEEEIALLAELHRGVRNFGEKDAKR
jgi:hypothetical protein